MDSIRANYDEKFFRKFLYIALVLFAYSVWCLYDGLVAYPAKLVRAKVYHEELAGANEDRDRLWLERVEQEGWPEYVPEVPEKVQNGIDWQYIQLIGCFAVAIPMVLKYVLARGSFVEADDNELRPSWTKPVSLDAVTKVDKSRWAKKGIAKVYYQAEGKSQVFVMDDFKFDRAAMSQIMRRIEARLDDSAVIGGPRESEVNHESTS